MRAAPAGRTIGPCQRGTNEELARTGRNTGRAVQEVRTVINVIAVEAYAHQMQQDARTDAARAHVIRLARAVSAPSREPQPAQPLPGHRDRIAGFRGITRIAVDAPPR